ncbi:unnamed protein product [Amoebophrya sp. A25]|nr:unnamed protein product [Amoebophrya sp. A25]|eukprot:GSA25T00009244001.1
MDRYSSRNGQEAGCASTVKKPKVGASSSSTSTCTKSKNISNRLGLRLGGAAKEHRHEDEEDTSLSPHCKRSRKAANMEPAAVLMRKQQREANRRSIADTLADLLGDFYIRPNASTIVVRLPSRSKEKHFFDKLLELPDGHRILGCHRSGELTKAVGRHSVAAVHTYLTHAVSRYRFMMKLLAWPDIPKDDAAKAEIDHAYGLWMAPIVAELPNYPSVKEECDASRELHADVYKWLRVPSSDEVEEIEDGFRTVLRRGARYVPRTPARVAAAAAVNGYEEEDLDLDHINSDEDVDDHVAGGDDAQERDPWGWKTDHDGNFL